MNAPRPILITLLAALTSCQQPPVKQAEATPVETAQPLPAWTKSKGSSPRSKRQFKFECRFIEITYEQGDPNIPTKPYQTFLNDTQRQVALRKFAQRKGVDIMTTPTVVSRDGQTAKIEIGREFLYPDPKNPDNIKKEQLGVSNHLLARSIKGQQAVETNILAEVKEFTGFRELENDQQEPVFATRRINSTVSLKNGQTILLGGLVSDRSQNIEDKAPFLGDIPVVKNAFTGKSTYTFKTELILMVTLTEIDPTGKPVTD